MPNRKKAKADLINDSEPAFSPDAYVTWGDGDIDDKRTVKLAESGSVFKLVV